MSSLFIDALTTIDITYFNEKLGLIGDSWELNCKISGPLNTEGMIIDFSDVKKTIKTFAQNIIDHKFVIPKYCPQLDYKIIKNNIDITGYINKHDYFFYQGPLSSVYLLPYSEVTCDLLIKDLSQHVKSTLPTTIDTCLLDLKHEIKAGNFFQYSHGLPLHNGDCQRIAHGHRSKIEILLDGTPNTELLNYWLKQWNLKYFASLKYITNSFTKNNTPYFSFSYQASQGTFELCLPQNNCFIFNSETTIENITNFLAHKIKQDHPRQLVTVKVFEGINKGSELIL